jgi:hypothetical protein
MTREQLRARARRAQEILDDEVFHAALEDARQATIEEWVTSPTVEGREAAWAQIRGLGAVQQGLRRIVSAGEHTLRV